MFSLTNELEQSLLLAMTDGEHLPDFYHTLLNSSVHIYAKLAEQDESEEASDVQFGQNIIIQHWDAGDDQLVIPFFSSSSMLSHSGAGEENAMNMATQMLFSLAPNVPMVLNPGTAFERFFTADEIKALLVSGMPDPMTHSELDEDQEFEFTAVEDAPEVLVSRLTEQFEQNEKTLRAWMVVYRFADTHVDELLPRLMIGLEFDNEQPEPAFIQAVSMIAAESIDNAKYSHVDFMVVEAGDNEISDYLIEEIEPFYTKS